MKNKIVKTTGTMTFVESMLKSAQEVKEVKPQTRHDHVDMAELEKTMAKIKKGQMR